jgi:hypothetical protein
LQNTDPLVFGDRFLYSNCRQARNRKLRGLGPGSLVVFGSKLGREFVIDTVFVVSDSSENFTRASAGEVRCEGWVRAVVFEPLRLNSGANESFRLYRGQTLEDAPSGPFSFVPCRPYGTDASAFPRPVLHLARQWIEPNLAMAAKVTAASPADIRGIWEEIVDQVQRSGLALGVHLEAPAHLAETQTSMLDSEDPHCK